MKISIVTISYNQAQYLEETINSVIQQRGVDLEYIVVDAGSTDNSREIIRKYSDRINHIVFEKDNGPADGLNKGFKLATGDVYGYLNSDDVLIPGALKEVSDFFKSNDNVDIVSGHCYIIDDFSRKVQKKFSHRISNSTFSRKRYTTGFSIIVQQSTFFKKEVYEKVNGFDDDYRLMWDAALMVDFLKINAKFAVQDKYWSMFRVYPASISGSGKQLTEKGQKEFKKLQLKSGLKQNVFKWEYQLLRFIGWLTEPNLLFKRIIDGFYSPKRVI